MKKFKLRQDCVNHIFIPIAFFLPFDRCYIILLCYLYGIYIIFIFYRLWRWYFEVIYDLQLFGIFLAEVVQKPNLISAHPQITLWYEKCVKIRNSTFLKYFCTMVEWYPKLYCRHKDRHTTAIPVFNKICYTIPGCHVFFLLSFHKSGSSTLTLTGDLICLITPHFSWTKKSVRMAPVCGCNLK